MNILDRLRDAIQRWSGDHDQRLAASAFVVLFIVLMLLMLLTFAKAGLWEVGR